MSGWWVVIEDATGRVEMLKRDSEYWYSGFAWGDSGVGLIRPTLPPGWTLGPSLAELLQRAAAPAAEASGREVTRERTTLTAQLDAARRAVAKWPARKLEFLRGQINALNGRPPERPVRGR